MLFMILMLMGFLLLRHGTLSEYTDSAQPHEPITEQFPLFLFCLLAIYILRPKHSHSSNAGLTWFEDVGKLDECLGVKDRIRTKTLLKEGNFVIKKNPTENHCQQICLFTKTTAWG